MEDYEPIPVDIEEANRLYDKWEGDFLIIEGWDNPEVSVKVPRTGNTLTIEKALNSERYIPVNIKNISE